MTRLGCRAGELRSQARRLAAVDQYLGGRGLAGGLPFEDMAEARLAEERLRALVESWLSDRGGGGGGGGGGGQMGDGEIEFTMRLGVKGKRARA